MVDFFLIATRMTKSGVVEIYPKFLIKKSTDLMIRGGDFYAIWLENESRWSTEEQDALQLIDYELDKYAEEYKNTLNPNVHVLHLWDAETGLIDCWHKYCQKQMRDYYYALDEQLIFSNTVTTKTDYSSKRLNYPLERGECPGWDTLLGTLYSPEERHKIEWSVGAIVSGDSKDIQKFMVLYGSAGTGKSTVLNIIQKLFAGYYSVFDARALGSSSNSFALEAFKKNPLVAIQHDGDLSKIEDNTRLNSLVSHEDMTVNEKFKAAYTNKFKAFLYMGTNKPVKITDAKSGLIRRLIDVSPSGEKLQVTEYKSAVAKIDFELGAIATHCLDVYEANRGAYDDYIPISMMGASNDFYNFVEDNYFQFKDEDGVTLKRAWDMYKLYCDEAKVAYPFSKRIFKEELRNYFKDYKDRWHLEDGTRVRSYYIGFISSKFENTKAAFDNNPESDEIEYLTYTDSIFDEIGMDYKAQYAAENGAPINKWDNVKTTLQDLDTTKLHYVRVPLNHIIIDFDIQDANGDKSLEENLKAASKWPATYMEYSKSGKGIHLHYIYKGDPETLSSVYSDHIEVKVYKGNSSLRRCLSKCNNLPIATISSGLPLKGDKKMLDFDVLKNEKSIRTLIKRNLNKEIHPGTKPSIDFIHKILDDSYEAGIEYNVENMKPAILAFAMSSTHQADYCLKLVKTMKFKSEEKEREIKENESDTIVFYDVEVFPNLFIVNWKMAGEDKQIVRMINPTPNEIELLMHYKLVGFNNRRYDNHILYARMMGYSNEALFKLSSNIVGEGKGYFGEAWNLSYTDIYDFSVKKQGLKKWEIELGLKHHELGLPWDQPVPEERWVEVAEYCDNDVLATEAVFNHLQSDFTARCILAEIAGGRPNDTTNSLTTKIIFGGDKNPPLVYTDLATGTQYE
ncbi:MAG: DUF5906 domain-containing protein [Sarcina sp.]